MISIDTKIARARLDAFPKAYRDAMAKTITETMRVQGRALEKAIEARIAGSGLGDRLPRAMKSEVYPNKGRVSMGATAYVHAGASDPIIDAFANGAEITGKDGGWLAIPSPRVAQVRGYRAVEAAPGGGVAGVGRKTARITPASFQAATGLKLDYVYTGGAVAFLFARGVRSTNRLGYAPGTKRRSAQGRAEESFIAFFLVRRVSLRKRFDLTALAAEAQAALRPALADAIARGIEAAAIEQNAITA